MGEFFFFFKAYKSLEGLSLGMGHVLLSPAESFFSVHIPWEVAQEQVEGHFPRARRHCSVPTSYLWYKQRLHFASPLLLRKHVGVKVLLLSADIFVTWPVPAGESAIELGIQLPVELLVGGGIYQPQHHLSLATYHLLQRGRRLVSPMMGNLNFA